MNLRVRTRFFCHINKRKGVSSSYLDVIGLNFLEHPLQIFHVVMFVVVEPAARYLHALLYRQVYLLVAKIR